MTDRKNSPLRGLSPQTRPPAAMVNQPAPVGLDAGMADEPLVLVSKIDGSRFNTTKQNARVSMFIRTALEDKDATEVQVDLPAVLIQFFVTWMDNHKGLDILNVQAPLRFGKADFAKNRLGETALVPAQGKDDKDAKDAAPKETGIPMSDFDVKFMEKLNVNRAALYDFYMATNYLDIQGLLHLCAAKIASLEKDKPGWKLRYIQNPDWNGKYDDMTFAQIEANPPNRYFRVKNRRWFMDDVQQLAGANMRQ